MIITSVQYSPTGDELVVGLNSGRILVLREQKRRNNDLKIHHILDFVTHEVLWVYSSPNLDEVHYHVSRKILVFHQFPSQKIAPCLLLVVLMGNCTSFPEVSANH